MAFENKFVPKNKDMKPFKPPAKPGYDVMSIDSWEEAEELLKAGKITQSDWEKWVDLACGGSSD